MNESLKSSELIFKDSNEIYSMMDSLPFNVMYAGLDLVIKYVNPQSLETLKN